MSSPARAADTLSCMVQSRMSAGVSDSTNHCALATTTAHMALASSLRWAGGWAVKPRTDVNSGAFVRAVGAFDLLGSPRRRLKSVGFFGLVFAMMTSWVCDSWPRSH